MNTASIRRHNLLTICETTFKGNETALSRKLEKAASQIHDMLNGKKAFGEKIARSIEQKLNLPQGYLDIATPQNKGITLAIIKGENGYLLVRTDGKIWIAETPEKVSLLMKECLI